LSSQIPKKEINFVAVFQSTKNPFAQYVAQFLYEIVFFYENTSKFVPFQGKDEALLILGIFDWVEINQG